MKGFDLVALYRRMSRWQNYRRPSCLGWRKMFLWRKPSLRTHMLSSTSLLEEHLMLSWRLSLPNMNLLAITWTSGLTLVNGKVKGGVWAEVGVQGAGHRPDAGADATQDVPQVQILKIALVVTFFRAKKIPVADKKKKKEDTDGEVNMKITATHTLYVF